MTTEEGLSLEITMLTADEASAIWKRQTKRAPNYARYLAFMNTHDVGASWNTKVPAGDKNADYAKEIRHNFNEAAKERTRTVGEGDAATQVPAPVLIRWKSNTHKEQRQVQDGKKTATIEVEVIDSLDALIIATEAVAHRGPRAVTEEVTVVSPPADAKAGTKVTLADGRTAVLSKAGKWRAPKVVTPATPLTGAAEGATNGVAETAGVGTPA